MTAATVWLCDGCDLEGRDGYPGAPPDGWVRANASIAGHVRSRDRDFCPACARSVDLIVLAESGDLLAPIGSAGSSKSKRKSKGVEPALDLEDGEVLAAEDDRE